MKRALDKVQGHFSSIKILEILSSVQLNVSTVYSEINSIDESLKYANLSLETAKQGVIIQFNGKPLEKLENKEKKSGKSLILVIISAYVNIAISKSILKQNIESNTNFKQALELAQSLSEENLELINKIKQKYKEYILISNSVDESPYKRCNSQQSERLFQQSYYSPEKLKKVSTNLQTEQKFVSADEFFFKKITNALKIPEQGIPKTITKEDESQRDKRIMSTIRYKRHQKSFLSIESKSNVEDRIQSLQREVSDHYNRQTSQMKSKLRTSYYKKLIRSLNFKANKSLVPPQSNFYLGLFFIPPSEKALSIRKSKSKKPSD